MFSRRLLGWVLALIPIGYCYSFPFIINNLGHAMFLFIVFPLLILDGSNVGFNGMRRNYVKYYLFFSLYLAFNTVMAPLLLSYEVDTLAFFSALEFAITILFLISDTKLSRSFINAYIYVAVFSSLYIIMQYVVFTSTGKFISGSISFLNEYEREVGSMIDGRILRFASIFAEASHYAVYQAPALIMLLWGKTKHRLPIIKIIVISIGVLLSTSSNGIIIMGLIYASYIIYKYFTKLKPIYIIIGCVIFYVAYTIIINSTFLGDVTYGLLVQEQGMSTSKADGRIYRGFLMFADLPIDRQLFGVGWRSAETYCQACNQRLLGEYAYDGFDYFNSIAGSLIYSGILGFGFLLLFFVSMFKFTKDYAARVLIICVFILMGTSSILLSDQWIYFLAAIVALINSGEHEKINNYHIAQRYSYSQ